MDEERKLTRDKVEGELHWPKSEDAKIRREKRADGPVTRGSITHEQVEIMKRVRKELGWGLYDAKRICIAAEWDEEKALQMARWRRDVQGRPTKPPGF